MDTRLTDIVVGRRRLDPKRIPPSVREVIGKKEATQAWLFNEYKPLAATVVRDYFLPGAERADLHVIALAALAKACGDYDPAKSSFAGFARMAITRGVISAIKSATRKRRDPRKVTVASQKRLSEGVSTATWFEKVVEAASANEASEELCDEWRAKITQGLQTLTELERNSLVLHAQGYTYEQIGGRIGCPPKKVDNALQRARRKLRAM